MMPDLDVEEWGEIVDDVEPATYSEVPIALEDRLDLTADRAEEMVDGALASGVLAEGGPGVFPTLTVADASQEATEPDKSEEPPDGWDAADFTTPESNVWPPSWEARDFWMGRKGKKPYAPWGDADNPDAPCTKTEHEGEHCGECPCDARYKWSVSDNWADKETVDEYMDIGHTIDGHVALLQKEYGESYNGDPDPYVLVDGDDVRCPETGEVHPRFKAILEELGLTYADVSTSGGGVHAMYEGQLPEKHRPAVTFDLAEEPWGENDEAPGVEFYDGKRVCVVTGEHVPGSAADVKAWDAEAAEKILDENTPEEDRRAAVAPDRDRPDLEDYDPTATGADEVTAEIRDIFAAIDRLGPRELRINTRQTGSDGTGWEQWDPSFYRSSSGEDSLHTPDQVRWYDQKTHRSFGVLDMYAADQDIIGKPWHDLSGEDFWDAVDALRDDGHDIPVYIPGCGSGDGGGSEYEKTPHWALRKAAVALHVLPEGGFVTKESDDGETYEGFPGRVTFDRTLDELEALGIEHGWERDGSANKLPTRDEAGLNEEPENDGEKVAQAFIEMCRSG